MLSKLLLTKHYPSRRGLFYMPQLLLPSLQKNTTNDDLNDDNGFEDAWLNKYGMSTDIDNFIVLFGQFKVALGLENKIIQNISALRVLIDNCKRAIPKIPLFQNYRDIFYDYTTAVEETLEYLEIHGADGNKLLDNIGRVADELTEGYQKGYVVLLMSDGRSEELKENYYDYLDVLEGSVYTLNEYVFSVVKDDLKQIDSKSQKILSSLVSGYLHDDL